MFQVGRYDPKDASKADDDDKKRSRSPRKKKRARHDEEEQEAFVIAPEEKESRPTATTSNELEAFDDFDIIPEGVSDEDNLQERELERAQILSKLPMEEAAQRWKLAPFLIDNLKRHDVEHFFPIQAMTLPHVLASLQRQHNVAVRDVSMCAATGSGKTLAYVLPIVHALSKRQIRRLRALVVLPSRDLAKQVHAVFEEYVQGSDLRVGLAIGQQSDFATEQLALTVDPKDKNSLPALRQRLVVDPTNLGLAIQAARACTGEDASLELENGMSAVDILVCTPGRLVGKCLCENGIAIIPCCYSCLHHLLCRPSRSYTWLYLATFTVSSCR
jgi:hypothetical protein